MLRSLILKEWLTSMMELRFLVCSALCVFLGIISVFVLHADLATKRDDFARDQVLYRNQVEEYGNYRDLQNQGIRVDRPPQSFQVLFYGVEKTLDRTAQVSGDFNSGFEADLNTNPSVLLFPVADMLFVVAVVLSLLAFFISYDAVAGERETGTLKLVLSYALPRDQLILAKWIGGYLSLAVPFVVSLLIGALLISTSADIPFMTDDWQAFFIAGAISLLLLAVMFSIGLLVSVRASNSTTAILSLLAIWVLIALIIPNQGPYLAELIAPVPGVSEVERSIALTTKTLSDQYFVEFRNNRRNFRNMSGAERREMRRKFMEARDQLQVEVNTATEKIVRNFESRLTHQIEVSRLLTRISPVASYVYANTDIGETGVRHEERLVAALRTYQREFDTYVEKQLELSGGGGFGHWGGGDDEDYNVDGMPVFEYRKELLGGRVTARSTDVLLMSLFAVLFFMAAFVSFLRSDVT
ncbi:MAG: ABC transporter permease subunit [Candidatus Latescibacterota bacterium]|nr:ABC transporter permease subunit [Candidatus Latescibacterota bacterium]